MRSPHSAVRSGGRLPPPPRLRWTSQPALGRLKAAPTTAALLLTLGLALASGGQAAAQTPQTPPAPIGEAEIERALETVKADPNLATQRTIRLLRWKDSGEPSPPSEWPAWLRWIGGLFEWFVASARVLAWAVVAALAGVLALYLARLIHAYRAPQQADAFIAPTHVRSLDIRPESLPDDIGRAARALWARGEPRAALALLYRGLLSRLVHVHQVPIRDASTEGDCLALTTVHLTRDRHAYASRLVVVWQHAIYGGQPADEASVHWLCDQFAPMLDAPSQATTEAAGAAHGATA